MADVVQALELADAQADLQRIQTAPAGPSSAPVLQELASTFASFLVGRLLRQRSRSRAEFAPRLGFTPLQHSPFPDALVDAFRAREPVAGALLPHASVAFLVSTAPPSVSHWAPLIARGERVGLGESTVPHISTRRWPCSRCYLLVGIEQEPARHAALAGVPNRHLRLCGALVSCTVDAIGRVRRIEGLEAMPARVFRAAEQLCHCGAGMMEVLQALGSHAASTTAAAAHPTAGAKLGAVTLGAGSKRHRSVGPATDADPAPAAKVLRTNELKNGRATDAAAPPAAARAEATVSEIVAAWAPGAPVSSSNQPWGAAEVALERLQVACMAAWSRERALGHHIRLELSAAGVAFAEERGHQAEVEDAGTADAAHAGPLGAAITLRDGLVFSLTSIPTQGGGHFTLPERHIAWPRMIPAPSGSAPEDCSAGVSSARILVTGRTWRLRVMAPLLRAALRTLPHKQRCGWRECSDNAATLVLDCDTAAAGYSVAQCWQAVAELLHTRDLLVMFAVVHCPHTERDKGSAGAAQDSAADDAAGTLEHLKFSYPETNVVVELAALNMVRIRACATSASDTVPALPDPGSASLAEGMHVNAAEQVLQQLDFTFPLGHVLHSPAAPGVTAAGSARAPQWSALEVFAGLNIAAQPPKPRELMARFYPAQLRSAAPQTLLDGLAYTSVGHAALARAAAPAALASLGLQAGVRVGVTQIAPPYRALLRMAHGVQLPSGAQGCAEVACGIELRAGGLALVHFDLRGQQGAILLHMQQQQLQARTPGRPQTLRQPPQLRMPQEVPGYAALVQAMLGGDAPLAWRVQDVKAMVAKEQVGGRTVVVQQADLERVANVIVKHVDAQLTVAPC
jgi:hypothetical protein